MAQNILSGCIALVAYERANSAGAGPRVTGRKGARLPGPVADESSCERLVGEVCVLRSNINDYGVYIYTLTPYVPGRWASGAGYVVGQVRGAPSWLAALRLHVAAMIWLTHAQPSSREVARSCFWLINNKADTLTLSACLKLLVRYQPYSASM